MGKKASKMSSQELKEATDAEVSELKMESSESVKISQDVADSIWNKHSNRGQLAMEMAKSMLSGETSPDVDSIVKTAFSVVDTIQIEIDKGYNKDLIEAHVSAAKSIGKNP